MCGEAMEALSWSYPVHILSCPPEPREQLNSVTAFIDASSVYGSTTEEEEELREAGGRGRVMVELVVVVGGGGSHWCGWGVGVDAVSGGGLVWRGCLRFLVTVFFCIIHLNKYQSC